jgi:lysophospholipase L1-like esterase
MSWFLLPLLASAVLGGPTPGPRLALKDGDRVVFLGGGFFELERLHGHLAARLTRGHPEARLVFRNLGWAGDTVRGEARTGGFQQPEGLARLLQEVRQLKPTVVLLGYGMNESFAGAAGLSAFLKDYEALLTKLVPLKARVALLSPTYHEDLGRPFPDPASHNRDLRQYVAALRQLAARRGLPFVDLFEPLQAARRADPARRLTTNGIHLTEAGYALAARAVEEQLGLGPRPWRVELDRAGKVLASAGTQVDGVTAAGGAVRFRTLDAVLPAPGETRLLRVTGLGPGEYALKIDGRAVLRATAADWQRGVALSAGPAFADAEKLRKLIVHTGELFYRRWRPFNDHSRHWGFIGGDFALYDQEIGRAEEAVAQARRPRPHTYEITATGGKQ